MTKLQLSERDVALRDGAEGGAAALSMRLLLRAAEVLGASRLIDISRAHIDGCLYHGPAGLDFAEKLARDGGRVAVPTTLNVSSLDLIHPELYRGDARTGEQARRLMDAYVTMGCEPTWTCAPYQLRERPAFGEQIAWAESNAIVFANSVLGARTNRYGDFLDIAAALTGRVPEAGLHVTAGRSGRVLFRVNRLPESLVAQEVFAPILGHLVGSLSGSRIPVIEGLPPDTGEDALKALGAAAASSGAVALFHAVGITPEAPSVEDAMAGAEPEEIVEVTADMVRRARDELSTAAGDDIDAVSVGTPHFSLHEIETLAAELRGEGGRCRVPLFASTGRGVLEEARARGWVEPCEELGVRFVTDTCTYVTPILRSDVKVVMTNSAKWAYYAPGNMGIDVVFGSLRECVRSAVRGRVCRDEEAWRGV